MCLAISGFPLWLEGLQPALCFSRRSELSTGELSPTQPQAQLFVEPLLSVPAFGVTQQKKKQPNHFRKSHAGFPFHSALDTV